MRLINDSASGCLQMVGQMTHFVNGGFTSLSSCKQPADSEMSLENPFCLSMIAMARTPPPRCVNLQKSTISSSSAYLLTPLIAHSHSMSEFSVLCNGVGKNIVMRFWKPQIRRFQRLILSRNTWWREPKRFYPRLSRRHGQRAASALLTQISS